MPSRLGETVAYATGTFYSECRQVINALGEEVAMFARNRVHTDRRIIYTETKEAPLMKRNARVRSSHLLLIAVLLVSMLVLVAASSSAAEDRGARTFDVLSRAIGSVGVYQELFELVSGIDEPGQRAEREALLADPRGYLAIHGIALDDDWKVTVWDLENAIPAGAAGFYNERDAGRVGEPFGIGVETGGVAMVVVLEDDGEPAVDAIDGAFDLVLGIQDSLVEQFDDAMELLDSQGVNSADRTDFRLDARGTLRDAYGVDISVLDYLVTGYDFDVADQIAANGGGALYTISAPSGNPPVHAEMLVLQCENIAIFLQQAL